MTRYSCGCEQHIIGIRGVLSNLRDRTSWELCPHHDKILEHTLTRTGMQR